MHQCAMTFWPEMTSRPEMTIWQEIAFRPEMTRIELIRYIFARMAFKSEIAFFARNGFSALAFWPEMAFLPEMLLSNLKWLFG